MLSTLARAGARAATGAGFAVLGWDAATAPGQRVAMAGPTLAAMRRVVPLPDDDEIVVRANGALMVAAGALLAVGARSSSRTSSCSAGCSSPSRTTADPDVDQGRCSRA